jgi:hypothetical protein
VSHRNARRVPVPVRPELWLVSYIVNGRRKRKSTDERAASMAVPTPEQRYARDVWVPRFAQRLRARQPRISGQRAMDLADSEYDVSCDQSPEAAADTYVDEARPGGLD